MARLLAIVVCLAGLQLVAAPAQAQVGLTIEPSKTSFLVGRSVTISGTVTNSEPGRVIRLQRRTGRVWTTLASKRVWSGGSYSFRTQPPRGYQYLRVVLPHTAGRPAAVSDVVKLAVRWHPSLVAASASLNENNTGEKVRVTGTVADSPDTPVVVLERQESSGWVEVKRREVQPDVEFTLEDNAVAGWRYRLRLLPTPLTTQEQSAIFTHTEAPFVMELNSTLELRDLVDHVGHYFSIEVGAAAGQWVSLYANTGGGSFSGTVTSPTGQRVGGLSGRDRQLRFTAPESGTYTIDISDWAGNGYCCFALSASVPKVVTTSIDAPEITASPDLNGQVLDIRFDTTGTSVFAVPNWSAERTTLLDPSGAVVQPWIPAALPDRTAPVYRGTGGTYTLRLDPGCTCNMWARPMSVTQLTGDVNGPDIQASIDEPYRVVLIEFERPAEHVTVGYATAQGTNHFQTSVNLFDAATGQPDPTGSGTSVAVVSTYSDWLADVSVELSTPLHLNATVGAAPMHVDLAGTYRRQVAFHFHANAGDVIANSPIASAGGWGDEVLTGPTGTVDDYILSFGWLWRIPADGDYTITATTYNGLVGDFALEDADQVTLPGDGTPTTVTVDEPGETVVVNIAAPGGTSIDATLDEISASLGDTWTVSVIAADNGYTYIRDWVVPNTERLLVREPGDLVALVHADQTGSLRLSQTAVS